MPFADAHTFNKYPFCEPMVGKGITVIFKMIIIRYGCFFVQGGINIFEGSKRSCEENSPESTHNYNNEFQG